LNQGGDGLNQGGDGLNQGGDNVNGGGLGVNLPDYGDYGGVNGGGSGINNNYGGDDLNDLYGDYDLANYLYETPPVEIDYFGPSEPEEDPVMYFDQITTTTVPPDMYDYLFAFEKPNRNKNRLKGANSNIRKKFDAQALKAAYATLLEKSKTKSKNNSDQEITRASRVPDFGFRNSRVPDFGFGKSRVTRSIFSSLYDNFSGSNIARSAEEIARQFLQRITGPGPKPRVWGLLDRRAPGVFRQGSFVKISLSQFSIVSTGTTGAALVAAAASSAAVVAVAASSPLGAALSVPALGLGTTAILSTGTSSTTFWDRFSTWPIFPLSGITEVWPFILTIFLIYVGIILLTDGDMLINAIQGSLNFGQAVARNVRRNMSEEVHHSGLLSTLSWIFNWRVPKVKHPQPWDVALNNYSAYAVSGKQNQRRRWRQNQNSQPATSQKWSRRKRKRNRNRNNSQRTSVSDYSSDFQHRISGYTHQKSRENNNRRAGPYEFEQPLSYYDASQVYFYPAAASQKK